MTSPTAAEKPASPAPPRLSLETLISGRALAAAGALLVLIGFAFLLDLSFARGWITPAERVALGIACGGVVIAASAFALRTRYRIVAECSTGLGAGLAYLSCWSTVALFATLDIPRALIFAVMTLVSAALAGIAGRSRSYAIALMGLIGAYLTPLLLGLSNIADNHVELAAYLLTATAGLLVLARRRGYVAVEVSR